MTSERLRQIEDLYHSARTRNPGERESFLAQACRSDNELHREVLSLLAQDDAGGPMEQPVLQVAARLLEDPPAARTLRTNAGKISHFKIEEKLGEGGMGVVYSAYDERLCRHVALKMIRSEDDDEARARFWREARSAAGVNHPNICQLYEIGEEHGTLFIAMELLHGETLAARLKSGPLSVSEAVQIELGILAALDCLHRKALVHRDLKPSNIFLSEHGVKVLDFGLARSTVPDPAATRQSVTAPGLLAGTPQYLAPEQLCGHAATALSDLFTAGGVLFEMVTGRPAFTGGSLPELFYAIQHEQPPALGGSSEVVAVDRVIHRALAKDPDDRYESANAMAQDLRMALLLRQSGSEPQVRTITRLIVLPFRQLRRDEDTDFLSFSLPEALTTSLAALQSLVVRSSLLGARFSGEHPDLRTIAAEANVDAAVTGTLLRHGNQLRVTAQLVEVPAGTLVWSHSSQVELRDLFQLQDELVERIVQGLHLPITHQEHRLLKHDAPESAAAYEFYLRANRKYYDWSQAAAARDLYLRCVQDDPQYAPAWARLGRCHRLLAKWGNVPGEGMTPAQSALERALHLNPELPVAHHLYAQLDADLGRSRNAMTRLLRRAQIAANDPGLFAGLTHACRYCGLFQASLAACRRAQRLDPQIRPSIAHTYFFMGEYERVLETSSGGDYLYVHPLALAQLGREREAIDLLRERLQHDELPRIRLFGSSLLALLEGRRSDSIDEIEEYVQGGCYDPEGLYYLARQLSYLGEHEGALNLLSEVAKLRYDCLPALQSDPWLDPLRTRRAFLEILRKVEQAMVENAAAFIKAGGDRILLVGAS
jgi:serine/threonine protein kinase